MIDIIYYKNHRLVLSYDGYWYTDSFKDSFKKLSEIKKHIDRL